MAAIEAGPLTVQMEGDFVVFLIGMRINNFLHVRRWWPVFRAMPGMIRELEADPAHGLLHARLHGGLRNFVLVQYWRSLDHLQRYAHNRDQAHLPAWAAFNKAGGPTLSVGIWHETFIVRAGDYECIYAGMPPFGLGRAGPLIPAAGRLRTAKGRLNAKAG